MSSSENYIHSAINGEASIVASAVASTRNHVLNRAAFKLGSIPDMPTDTATGALMLAAGANGYVKEHGQSVALKVIESGFRNGQRNLRTATPLRGAREAVSRPVSTTERAQAVVQATIVTAGDMSTSFPRCTQPDAQGKPVFQQWGKDGPPIRSDEKRRHVFARDAEPVRIKVMHKNGGAANWYRVRDRVGTVGWQARKPEGYVEVPYMGGADPFDREVMADEIYWPEGEKDVDTIVGLGALALTFGGTGDGLPSGCEVRFANRNVVILSDNDQGGRDHAEKKAAMVAPVASSIRIIHFPELSDKGDVSDWIADGHSLDDLIKRAEAAPVWVTPPVIQSPSLAGLDVVCMADVKPSAIDWLWQNWIALGKVSVLAGDGGRGKSTILCDLTARATTGNTWPDGAPRCAPASVIILAAEDDVGDTLAPRLLAAGANLARVFVIRSVHDESQRRRGFNLQADLERLEAEIRKHDNVRLVIIDPVSSYLGKVDSHKNSDVRGVLEPLGEMASRLGVAILCNNHFSKGGGSANSRIIGSVAFTAQARAVFIVTPDEADESRLLLIPSKMNIAPIKFGLAYRIEGCLIEHDGADIATSRIMYESAPITISADQALAALDGNTENRSEKSEAIDFLTDALRGGPVSAKDMKREAAEAGISLKSLRSAREALGIKPEKTGFGGDGGWVWNLPKVPS